MGTRYGLQLPRVLSADQLPLTNKPAAAGVTVPNIRYWTSEGLLEVAEVTASGYQLYAPEMVKRCARIQKLKEERLTLAEIKRRLG